MIQMETFTIEVPVIDDAENICSLMISNQERFQRFFPKTLAQNLTVDASKDLIKKKRKENFSKSEYTHLIKENSSRKIVGIIILKELNWNIDIGELAYCIDEKFEGRGWMTQIVEKFSKYALDILGLKSLQIIAHNTNKGSIRVAEKCGYIWKRTLENEFTPPNERSLDMELYELNR